MSVRSYQILKKDQKHALIKAGKNNEKISVINN